MVTNEQRVQVFEETISGALDILHSEECWSEYSGLDTGVFDEHDDELSDVNDPSAVSWSLDTAMKLSLNHTISNYSKSERKLLKEYVYMRITRSLTSLNKRKWRWGMHRYSLCDYASHLHYFEDEDNMSYSDIIGFLKCILCEKQDVEETLELQRIMREEWAENAAADDLLDLEWELMYGDKDV